jgi:hypothetical protein
MQTVDHAVVIVRREQLVKLSVNASKVAALSVAHLDIGAATMHRILASVLILSPTALIVVDVARNAEQIRYVKKGNVSQARATQHALLELDVVTNAASLLILQKIAEAAETRVSQHRFVLDFI